MSKVDYANLQKPEKLLVLKQHRAKPVNELVARVFKPGDTYMQTGLEKAEVIARDLATTDLKADVPKNTKRTVPKPGTEMFRDPVQVLSEKIDKLIDLITEQQKNKK